EVHLCDFPDDEHAVIMVPSSCHCRAVYDPDNSKELVNFVVPGYGACVANLGGAVQFTPDSRIVTNGLRNFTLEAHEEFDTTQFELDLRALSVACPELQTLSTYYINVVLSVHYNALRRWPIQYMSLTGIQQISDLELCLSDTATQMARTLVELKVTSRMDERLDEEEVKKLKAHDGEFLPVIKEKFPLQLKIAMISAVTSTSSTKAIHLLDTYILSLIFVFSSTPEQRVVQCEDI
ncbi:hypothetical protein PHMEG_00027007, partial [Phytophthora megakarya]